MKKKMIQILAIVMVASGALAQDKNIHICLEYMTTNYPGSTWLLQDDSNGQGIYIKNWNSALAQPTKPQILGVWPAAKAWKAALEKDASADLEKFDEKTKLFFKALVICINKRLPAGNKITADELKTEARALLDQ